MGEIYHGKGKVWVSGAGFEWQMDVEPWLRLFLFVGEEGYAMEGTLQLTNWTQGVALYVLRRGTLFGFGLLRNVRGATPLGGDLEAARGVR